ncbi:hypothetical protein Clacol_005835 [Clathrus columnatus]|uniref:UBX domain-containing protein 1 n=1 Tax=Clathrus columnatus TaxID=1419009 RepID=A0AAV5AFB8_9AGAM|nr:hypothetical protein Clacol_005835 [Clathrus columnatus]
MPSDKDTLLSMGFDIARVEWALKATSNRGLQPAMDHILENQDKPIPDLTDVSALSSASATNNTRGPAAMDEDDEDTEALKAVYGSAGTADGSGMNVDVEAKIKPLTEEEKKQKLEELRQKMAEKRSKKAEQDALDNKANELLRRKAARDMGSIKEELRAKEAIKEAEQKRKDKIADAKAKAAVKAQIEADRRERAEKAAREKALRQGNVQQEATPSTTPSSNPVTSTSGAASSKEYKETRLQIRLASGGQPYTTTLPSDSTLRQVAEFLAGQTLAVDVDTVSFAQHFPRKQFNQNDFTKTLKELGLTPSAVLIAS